MNIISILRFMKGYIQFKAVGGFSDRFLNLCTRHSVKIFDVCYSDDAVIASVPIKEVYKLKNICKSSGVKLHLIKKCGLYFVAVKYADRIGLLSGIAIYVLFLLLMQQFIWSIEIQSSENVSRQQIAEKLTVHGLTFGTFKNNFDEISCAREIVNEFSGKIQWMAINIKGSKAFVEIHDYDKIQQNETYSDPCNIIADFDGVILNIEAYNGQKIATAGNGVSEGDLLISGIVENRDLSVSYHEARGTITAIHRVNLYRKYNNNKKYGSFSHWKKNRYLYILGLKIPLMYKKSKKNEKTYIKNSYFTLAEETHPFGITDKTSCKTNKTDKDLTQNMSSLISLENYSSEMYSEFANSNITDYNITVSVSDDGFIIDGDYECIDFMGKKQKINSNFSDFL